MQLIFSLADISRSNLDLFSSTRYSAAVLPLVGRYQIAAAGLAQFNQTNFEDWRINASAIDLNTGPIAMGAFSQYSTGKDDLEGAALPGWKLPEESLERDFSDLIVGGGACLLSKSQDWTGSKWSILCSNLYYCDG